MPEEEKTELENDGKLVKEVYIDREVVDKFWIENSRSYYGKPEKGMLGTLIFNNDYFDERVFLLMGSDCGTEDLMMEREKFSECSDGISFNYEPITRSMVVSKRLKDYEEESKFSQGENKEGEVTNTMETSTVGESKRQEDGKIHDLVTENMITFGREAQENINGIQQYSGTLPYSGSISLRSTSSTASTQSFAFPILAQEWNGSPIRMVNPDNRKLRNQKSWKMRMNCFCCRF